MICISTADDRMGLSFLGKRLSRDRNILPKIEALVKDAPLYLAEDAFMLWEHLPEHTVYTQETPCAAFPENAYCFAEGKELLRLLPAASKLILFRWNRHYPSDVRLTLPEGFRLVSQEDFVGNSHKTITMEVYTQ